VHLFILHWSVMWIPLRPIVGFITDWYMVKLRNPAHISPPKIKELIAIIVLYMCVMSYVSLSISNSNEAPGRGTSGFLRHHWGTGEAPVRHLWGTLKAPNLWLVVIWGTSDFWLVRLNSLRHPRHHWGTERV